MPVQHYTKQKKITNFCLNEEVYRGGVNTANKNVSQTDQICICASNTLFFLEAEFVTGIYKFTEDNRPAVRKGFNIGATPEQLLWDGDKIYIAVKREKTVLRGPLGNALGSHEGGAYTILDYNNGNILATLPLQQGESPMMSVLNDKLLVVTQNGTRAHFMSANPGGGQTAVLSRSPSFNLEQNLGNA
jgi:hypothetical protein